MISRSRYLSADVSGHSFLMSGVEFNKALYFIKVRGRSDIMAIFSMV